MKVVCNILVKCVVEGIDFECFFDLFVGLSLIVFFLEYFGVVVCIFLDFVKKNEKFEVKMVVFEGNVVDVVMLVILFIYDEVVVCLMSVMKEVFVGKLCKIIEVVCV